MKFLLLALAAVGLAAPSHSPNAQVAIGRAPETLANIPSININVKVSAEPVFARACHVVNERKLARASTHYPRLIYN